MMGREKNENFSPLRNLHADFPAGVVVFLVALPLCLGVALASGAPLFSGIIAGMVGGIVIGTLGSSALSVSGPAAGLTTIVLASIASLGSFETFLLSVALAGVIQIILSVFKAGTIGNYFPASVIKGMLAAIGLILILKQIPHAFGYDKDYEGDTSFFQPDGENTFSELLRAFDFLNPGAIIICVSSLAVLIAWDTDFIRKRKFSNIVPGALVVVFLGVLINALFAQVAPDLAISQEHLVSLPIADDLGSFISQFTLPDFSGIGNPEVWTVAATLAIVASLESLLSIDAVDKLDPYKRSTKLNNELLAQGVGNFVSGMIGGLPITAVIVRSSANVGAGAKTKASTFIHGLLLLVTVLLIPGLLNKIPLASLAAILLTVGYKLAKPGIFISMYRKGTDQFIPFVVTILAILLTDLMIGIGIGMIVGLFFVLKTNFHRALFKVSEGNNHLIRLTKDVSFLNKAVLRKMFQEIPDGSYVMIDGSRSAFIDQDILEAISDFRQSAQGRNIEVELKQSVKANNPLFKA
jgi:MFS superfamily sulfate permease-like transporter